MCSQCIDRRFASVTAEMEAFDSPNRYQTDVFRGRLEGNGLTVAESYVRFAQKVFQMSAEELFTEYTQMGGCITPEDPIPSETAGTLASLVKRHTTSVVEVLRSQVNLAIDDLVPPSLPATCLIRLALAGGVAEPRDHVPPEITLTAEEEEESRRHKFRSALVIEATGSLENRRSNEVRLSGTSLILPDAVFLLFLRLIVALYQAEDGFVARGNRLGGGLVDEGIYPPDSLD